MVQENILDKVIKYEIQEYDRYASGVCVSKSHMIDKILDAGFIASLFACAILGIDYILLVLLPTIILAVKYGRKDGKILSQGKAIALGVFSLISGAFIFAIPLAVIYFVIRKYDDSWILIRILKTVLGASLGFGFGCLFSSICKIDELSLVILIYIVTIVIYILGLKKTTRFETIKKLSKDSPDTPISEIIAADTKEYPGQKINPVTLACAIIIAVGIAAPIGVTALQKTYVEYKLSEDENSYVLMRYNENKFERNVTFTIPTEYNGLPVTSVDGGAFDGCRSLSRVIIPESITYIGGEAFKDCKNLESVILPDNLEHIKGNTFENCVSLKEINMPKNLVEIHERAFYGCKSLENIKFHYGLVRIGAHAFHDCDSLTKLDFPDSLREIGSSAFRNCDNLIEVYVVDITDINERAFKESDTKVTIKDYSDEQIAIWDAAIDEYFSSFEQVYFAYKNGELYINEDTVMLKSWGDYYKYVDKAYNGKSDDYELLCVKGIDEILKLIDEASELGAKKVSLEIFPEILDGYDSDDRFVSKEWILTVDEFKDLF